MAWHPARRVSQALRWKYPRVGFGTRRGRYIVIGVSRRSTRRGVLRRRSFAAAGKDRAVAGKRRAIVARRVAPHRPDCRPRPSPVVPPSCQVLGLDENAIAAVYEKPGSAKIGHYVPGTRIPIRSDDGLPVRSSAGDGPVLNLAWHISEEIKSYMRGRGYRAHHRHSFASGLRSVICTIFGGGFGLYGYLAAHAAVPPACHFARAVSVAARGRDRRGHVCSKVVCGSGNETRRARQSNAAS